VLCLLLAKKNFKLFNTKQHEVKISGHNKAMWKHNSKLVAKKVAGGNNAYRKSKKLQTLRS